ncbi:MAG: low temperature requirement protein A [Thermoleophilia bacterium]
MTTDTGARPAQGVRPIELLWDLVFVFAVTQVTAFLEHDHGWAGAARGMLLLALMWWAWSAFVWVVNAHSDETQGVRISLMGCIVVCFITALALPDAFTTHGVLFAVSYSAVRVVHLALYADASRRGSADRGAITGMAATTILGLVLLVAGGFLSPGPRAALWTLAALIDYAGPTWFTRHRLRSLQAVAVEHFSERYGLFLIICLGESLVGVGLGARGHELTEPRLAAAAAGVAVVIALWFAYFGELAEEARSRLARHEEPVLAGADGYSLLHLVIVAGVILFAVGANHAIQRGSASFGATAALFMFGGLAAYHAGLTAFAWRLLGRPPPRMAAMVVLLAVLLPVAAVLPAWAAALLAAAACALPMLWVRRVRHVAV